MSKNFKIAFLFFGAWLLTVTAICGVADSLRFDIDSVARLLAQDVMEEIVLREEQNEYFRKTGAESSIDFVIDMRKWHFSKESPALTSSPFIRDEEKNTINVKINNFYSAYHHPVYVVLSPIILGYNELSVQGLKDVYDWFEMSNADFETLKQRYVEYLKQLQNFKAPLSPLSGSVSRGAILSVLSYISYKSDIKEWRVRYGTDFSVSDEIKSAAAIEKQYENEINSNESKYDFVGKRYSALDNHVNTIITAFQNNCLTLAKQQELDVILKANLAELNKPILIKVKGPKSWPLENRGFYLDPVEEEKNQSPLQSTSGGAKYFKIDDEGYININEIYANEQRAAGPEVIEIVIGIEELIGSAVLLYQIYNNSGEYSDFKINGQSKAGLLIDQAKDGDAPDSELLVSVTALRSKLVDKIDNESLTIDELRLAINLLFEVQNTLVFVYGQESLYPFPKIDNLQKVKVPPLEWYKIDPARSDEELLRQLQYVYENDRESLTEEEINLYFWLLCRLEGDCTGPDPLKFEWHHIIPQQHSDHPLVAIALKCPDKFYFNGDENLISLEKYSKETGRGRHGNHPDYNIWLFKLLNERITRYRQENRQDPDPCDAKYIIEEIIEYVKDIIDKESNLKVDEIGTKYK
jgi:hypothetical protein